MVLILTCEKSPLSLNCLCAVAYTLGHFRKLLWSLGLGIQGFPAPPARSWGKNLIFQLLDLPEVGLAGQRSKALLRQPGRLGIKKCFRHVFIPHGQVPISKMGLPEVKCSWVSPLPTFSSCCSSPWSLESSRDAPPYWCIHLLFLP